MDLREGGFGDGGGRHMDFWFPAMLFYILMLCGTTFVQCQIVSFLVTPSARRERDQPTPVEELKTGCIGSILLRILRVVCSYDHARHKSQHDTLYHGEHRLRKGDRRSILLSHQRIQTIRDLVGHSHRRGQRNIHDK